MRVFGFSCCCGFDSDGRFTAEPHKWLKNRPLSAASNNNTGGSFNYGPVLMSDDAQASASNILGGVAIGYPSPPSCGHCGPV